MFLDNDLLIEDADIFDEDMELDTWMDDDAVFCEGCDGLFEISAEMEQSWNNIMMESMRMEHRAIVNEDTELLNEAVSDTVDKIIEWVKEKARKLAQFFKNLYARMQVAVTNTDKFYAKYNGAVSEAGVDWNKIKTYKWKKKDIVEINQKFAGMMNTLASLSGATDAAKIRQTTESDVFKTPNIIKDVRDGSKKNNGNNGIGLDQAMKNIKMYKASVKAFKNVEKTHNKTLKQMLSDAKSSAGSNSNLKMQVAQSKKAISGAMDRTTGAHITCVTGLVADSLAIARVCIKQTKKDNKKSA